MSVPKPRKANCTETRAYCPISLLFFLLKMMEKLVDKRIRDDILGLCPLHPTTAQQPRKSSQTALHHIITHIEEAVENKDVTVEAFLDVEGAFDST
jgi:hypothetical protein